MKFEDYLMEQFMGDEPHTLDDDIVDAFEIWLANLEVEELIDHADVFANEQKGVGLTNEQFRNPKPTINKK